MKKTVKIIIVKFIFLAFYSNACSQGFDWQYNMRLPFEYPKYFLSLSTDIGLLAHSGDFSFIEKNITCCSFEKGRGNDIAFGLGAEYWHRGELAFLINLSFNQKTGEFRKINEIPRNENYILVTEYQYENTLNVIDINFGSKYRLFESHFFAGMLLNTAIIISEQHNFSEIKISPITDPFRDREIPTASVENMNTLIVGLDVLIGYDVNLGRSKYLSIYVLFNQQINSFLNNETWRTRGISAGIKFNRGVF